MPREVVNKTHVPMPDVYMEETLKGWLSRVYPLKTITWSASNEIGDQLGWFEFPRSLFNVTSLYEKVKNIHYFRANVRVSIRMNGTRMHYGKLLVTTSPYPTFDRIHYERTNNIYSATGYPFTIISPTENEPVDILVPFISPLMYSTINPAHWAVDSYERYDWGGVGIYVLNPLNSVGGPTNVSFTVFASFEDVSFAGYSAGTIPKPDEPVAPEFIKAEKPIMQRVKYEAQAKTVETEEASAKGQAGIVTRTLEKVSAISGALSLIPEISPLAATVEGVSSALTPVARYFGWCKPDNVCIQYPVGVKYADFAHSAGIDNSVKLALYPDNSVQPAMNILGNRPEMDFDYILSQPMLVAIIPWHNETSATVLGEIPVTPAFDHVENRTSYSTFNSHIARAFHYWRGDMRYYISVTCSAFHSGRLRVAWTPNDNETPASLEEGSNLISKVIDIQTETEFGIVVPFLSSFPYRTTKYYNRYRDGYPVNQQSSGDNGRLSISVLNQLTSTANPTPQVFINVFASSKNMKFGYPRKVSFADPALSYEAQGLTREEICSGPYYPIVPAKSYEVQGYCFGEEITNVKQLTNRPTPLQTYTVGTENTNPFGRKFDPYNTKFYGGTYVASGDGIGPVNPPFQNRGIDKPLPPGHWYYTIQYVGPATNVVLLHDVTGNEGAFIITKLFATKEGPPPSVEPFLHTGYVVTDVPCYGILVDAGQNDDLSVIATFSPAPGMAVSGLPNFYNWPPKYTQLPEWDDKSFIPVEVKSPISGNFDDGSASFAAYFLSMYRFWRGSLRYKLLELASSDVGTRAVFLKSKVADGNQPRPDQHRGALVVREPVSNVVEVTVPYYYNTFCKLANAEGTNTERRVDEEVVPVFTFVNNNRAGIHSSGVISVSTGDDFEYYFLVAPPIRYSTSQ